MQPIIPLALFIKSPVYDYLKLFRYFPGSHLRRTASRVPSPRYFRKGRNHVRFSKIYCPGGSRGRPGRPDEPFLFSSSFVIHGPDSVFFGRHGLCIGVCAQEGPVTKGRGQRARGRGYRTWGVERSKPSGVKYGSIFYQDGNPTPSSPHFMRCAMLFALCSLRLFIHTAGPQWDSNGPPCGPGRIQKKSPPPRKMKTTSAERYKRSRYSIR